MIDLYGLLNNLSSQYIKTANSNSNNQFQASEKKEGVSHSEQTPPATPAPLSEISRIAAALERIASALEKLNVESELNSTQVYPNSNPENYWITLPDNDQTQMAKASFIAPLVAKEKAPVSPPPAKLSPTPEPVKPKISLTTLPNLTPTRPNAPLPAVNGLNRAVLAGNNSPGSVLHNYLNEQGISVQEAKKNDSPQEQAYQDKLVNLALYLGQNFSECKELYYMLKGSLITPNSTFSYGLKNFSAENKKKVRFFCHLLKGAGLLEVYLNQGTPECLIQLKTAGKEQKYLSGSWLEYYVKQEVARIARRYHTQYSLSYEARSNLEIVFKDSSKTELDLFFALGQKVFCAEAKIRPNKAQLEAFLNRIKPLKLDHNSLLVVVADKTEKDCLELSQALGNLRIARLDNLEQSLTAMLNAALQTMA